METAELLSLVEHLEDNIDDLEESLEPLLEAALSATTKKLPVLDRAKLYVLIVYSIESLLFSYLRLNGIQAKEHPVFRELTRVKQYFEKIKVAEAGPTKPRENLNLNKQAAGRFIKHALAGNDKFDLERAEREAREIFLAKRKLNKLLEKKIPQEQPQHVDEAQQEAEAGEDSESESTSEDDKREDAVMADASEVTADISVGGQEAVADAGDNTVAQSGGLSRRQKYRDKTEIKLNRRQGSTAAMATPESQKDASKGRRKKRRGGTGLQKQSASNA